MHAISLCGRFFFLPLWPSDQPGAGQSGPQRQSHFIGVKLNIFSERTQRLNSALVFRLNYGNQFFAALRLQGRTLCEIGINLLQQGSSQLSWATVQTLAIRMCFGQHQWRLIAWFTLILKHEYSFHREKSVSIKTTLIARHILKSEISCYQIPLKGFQSVPSLTWRNCIQIIIEQDLMW